MNANALEKRIRALLASGADDSALRSEMEALALAERSFSGLVWLWGPELYRRNRIFFRPLILSRFGTYLIDEKGRVTVLSWQTNASVLEPWLAEADAANDVELFRKLYEWKVREAGWRQQDKRTARVQADVAARFEAAATPAERQIVLRKFGIWFEMSEETALRLYERDSSSAGYILNHLPSTWHGGPKRELWEKLGHAAMEKGDEDFRWKIYRRQVSENVWLADIAYLRTTIADRDQLNGELEKRHPEGWSFNAGAGFYELLRFRGRDVFPYVVARLQSARRGWIFRGSYGKMVDLARVKGWWDLWAGLVRVCATPKEFNREVRALLEDRTLDENTVQERLRALAGVSREWNWPGLGLAEVHQFEDETAVAFYGRFPKLLKGPFRLHLQSHLWGEHFPKFLALMLEEEDEELIDLLASRLATSQGRWGNAPKQLAQAETLADYYLRLKASDAVFARRAAAVLGSMPAYSIWNYNDLIRQNRLARLLFERSAASYLSDPAALADLVEGAEIHVMALAYRALGLNDARAREQAAQHLPLLLGTLLRPMHRQTRALAFGAVANGANTLENARRVLERARDALKLPDKKYPKEQLVGLIANLLHRWPELRDAREQPVVYERAAA